jgi:hypothetical protein
MRRRTPHDPYGVDFLIFGSKICSGPCERELPANSDYFGRKSDEADGLRIDCRDCHNEREQQRYRLRRQAKRQYRTAAAS